MWLKLSGSKDDLEDEIMAKSPADYKGCSTCKHARLQLPFPLWCARWDKVAVVEDGGWCSQYDEDMDFSVGEYEKEHMENVAL